MINLQVFEAALSQDQLPVLSGWLFEALCHLLHGKVTENLLPYCLLTLLVSASSNRFIRKITPLCYHILKLGLTKCAEIDNNWGDFASFVKQNGEMTFGDKRLLCVVALHSGFSGSQLERMKELCDGNDSLKDLLQCLTA